MTAPSERRRFSAWLTLAGLALLAGLAVLGARGVAKYEMGDDYANDVQMTATGMMRFHATQTGGASAGSTSTRVQFMDIVNNATGEATLRLYTPVGFGTAGSGTTNVKIYVPAGAARSIDGMAIDSVSVDTASGIGGTTPIIFTGMKRR